MRARVPEIDAFATYLAGLTDETERARVLAKVKSLAADAAPDDGEPVKFGVPIGRTAADLLTAVAVEPDWIIPRVMARTWMVKFAAREKTGKGTLILNLLGSVERGERTVFGAATSPTTAIIYTEEPEDSMREKIAQAGLQDALIVYGWELAKTTPTWHEKVDYLVQRATEDGHGIVFVDNISRAAGVEDEAGVELGRAAEYLSERCKGAGIGAIIDHHHKKGAGKLDDKSRGGTALAGACENNIEMERVGGWESRVRKLSARGRISATIWTQTIALSDDGSTYDLVADDTQPQTATERQRLRKLDDAGDAGMTVAEFAAAIEKSNDTARRALEDFSSKGWAHEIDGSYPATWRSTGEGLDGPVDLLTGDDPDPLAQVAAAKTDREQQRDALATAKTQLAEKRASGWEGDEVAELARLRARAEASA